MGKKIFNPHTLKLVSRSEAKSIRIKQLQTVVDRLQESLDSISVAIGAMSKSGYYDYDPYCHGFLNGLLFAANKVAGKDIQYTAAPDKWLRSDEIVTEEYKALPPDPRGRTRPPKDNL